MTIDSTTRSKAVRHLRRRDPVIRAVIDQVGPFTLELHSKRFATIVYSIISQQVSTAAAASIRRRVLDLVSGKLTPAHLAALSDEQLRGAGVSPQKLRYLRDLTAKTQAGAVRFARHHRLEDAA